MVRFQAVLRLWEDFRGGLVTGLAGFNIDFAGLSGNAHRFGHLFWRQWRWPHDTFSIEGAGLIGWRKSEDPAIAVRGGGCFEVY